MWGWGSTETPKEGDKGTTEVVVEKVEEAVEVVVDTATDAANMAKKEIDDIELPSEKEARMKYEATR